MLVILRVDIQVFMTRDSASEVGRLNITDVTCGVHRYQWLRYMWVVAETIMYTACLLRISHPLWLLFIILLRHAALCLAETIRIFEVVLVDSIRVLIMIINVLLL